MSKTEIEQNSEMLKKLVASRFPNATKVDLQKLTPTGVKMRTVFRDTAREMAMKTGDKTWLKIGEGFGPVEFSAKPAPQYETK